MGNLREILRSEINAGKPTGLWRTLWKLWASPSKGALLMYRLAHESYRRKRILLAYFLRRRLITRYGLFISLKAHIGSGLHLPHANGIIIGDGVVIGTNATIYHQVTIGGRVIGDQQMSNYPVIGDNVVIFAGAKVLGSIRIGDNAVIGANSVVLEDVPAGSVAVGVPARTINRRKR
jgi:serine O-acetyltransferase